MPGISMRLAGHKPCSRPSFTAATTSGGGLFMRGVLEHTCVLGPAYTHGGVSATAAWERAPALLRRSGLSQHKAAGSLMRGHALWG